MMARQPARHAGFALSLLLMSLLVCATMPAPARAGFGVTSFDGQITNQDGSTASQAASHPYAVSTTIAFHSHVDPLLETVVPDADVKDVTVDLPPGLVGNPTATPARCELAEMVNRICPLSSQVGAATVHSGSGAVLAAPVYNLVSPPDLPGEFGFVVTNVTVLLRPSVRSGTDYGLTVTGPGISQAVPVLDSTVTFWGVPADASHDIQRCPSLDPHVSPPVCDGDTFDDNSSPHSAGTSRVPFLRTPTTCTAPGVGLEMKLSVDSWQNPGVFEHASVFSHLPGDPLALIGSTGCEIVPFDPSLSAQPGSSRASALSGWAFDVGLPQNENPDGLAQSDLKKTVVTLPAGVRLSPSSADGLQGCTPAQIDLQSTADPTCPDESKIGTVTIETPLLDKSLEGSVYLATPHENPFGSLVAIYLVAKGPGVTLKLPGEVTPDPVTGQLTTTFDNNPQLPFSNLHLQFNGGPRSPLVNPATCGAYTTRSQMTGWSGKVVDLSSGFAVDRANDGTPCKPLGFAPTFVAGNETPAAGGFSPFSLHLTRSDEDSEFSSLSSLSLPPGLLADVSSVSPRCSDAQASAAACPASSHIGEVTVGAGAGPNPFYVSGDVYLTDAYKGNPFGLAIVVHALAGPFDLGYVVARAGIQVHSDGSISTVTDPFPTILQGIPLQLRDIRVNLDRPGFIFNPTSCAATSISANALATDGQSAALQSRFQVGECARLPFHPSFSASTQGNGKFNGRGASLSVRIGSKSGPALSAKDEEANIAKTKVQLPLALPSRLSTLQKACTAAVFEANPAACPEGSFVGTALAHTPILSSPLTGPAVLVSHGGAAFPDLVMVLQGEGIRIDLTGHTQIKKGITYANFESVPDAPIQSFALNLPEGPHSVLAATKDLCAAGRSVTTKRRVTRKVHGKKRRVTVRVKRTVPPPLSMPTTMVGQNGAVFKQNTKIAVSGCAAPKATKAKRSHARANAGRAGR